MAPRKRIVGLRREDAARDNLRQYGFKECVISEILKEQLKLYDGGWTFIEEGGYAVLRDRCLERQNELSSQEQSLEIAEEQNKGVASEDDEQEEAQHVQEEQEETLTLTLTQTDAEPIISEAVTELSPPGAYQSGTDYAYHSVAGDSNTRCGWLSSEEEEEPEEDGDGDDEEMIQLTPEPLCEALEELVRKVRGKYKRKRLTKWDT